MYIESINTPVFASSGFGVDKLVRKEAVVLCLAEPTQGEIEKVLIHFKSEPDAIRFEKDLEDSAANILIDEDPEFDESGIKWIAIMTDHGVSAWGLEASRTALRKWMEQHGFPDEDWNLNVE